MYAHLQQRAAERPPVTLSTLAQMRQNGERITCLTAYDASFAQLLDDAGVDIVLAGDSLGMVIQGHDTTVPVTMEDMVYHTRAVARGLQRAFLMGDLPFMSYTSRDQALTNSVRLMQEGARIIKLESGRLQIEIVEYLRPQSVHKTGGFRVQGREQEAGARMVAEAKALEEAGADMLLLECIPSGLGKQITESVHVPVIGIGAGPDTNGQVLVLYDILNITQGRKPRFVKNFMDGASSCSDAVARYVADVKSGAYPAPEHCF